MQGPRPRRRIAPRAAALLLSAVALAGPFARGEDAPASRRPFPPRARDAATKRDARTDGQGGAPWWFGPTGVVVILAAGGWASLAARKYLPANATAAQTGLRVLGRTALSPKHSVYLLKAGDRVLIVGTGPQGAPSLLGEMDLEPGPPSRSGVES